MQIALWDGSGLRPRMDANVLASAAVENGQPPSCWPSTVRRAPNRPEQDRGREQAIMAHVRCWPPRGAATADPAFPPH